MLADFLKAPGRFISTIVRRVVGFVAFGILFLTGVSAAKALGAPSQPIALFGAFVSFGFFVVGVLLHEIGHAAAALVVGWRVHLIVVLRFGYRPRPRKLQLISRMVGGDYGGFVVVSPSPDRNWETGRATIFAAGSLANLTVALVCYSAIRWSNPGIAWTGLLGGLAVTNLVLGVSNLVPSWGQPGSKANDGTTLCEILAGKRMSTVMQIAAWLHGSSLDGVAARDWNPELLKRLELAEAASEQDIMVRDHVLVGFYESCGQPERALSILEGSQAALSGKYHTLTIERAFLLALVRREVDLAAQLLDSIPYRLHQSYFQYWRALSLVYALQGEAKLARTAVLRARKLAKTHGDEMDDDDLSLFRAIENGEAPSVPLKELQPA